MGLWAFLFGPRVPAEEEQARSPFEEGDAPSRRRYGRLASREDLARELRERIERAREHAADEAEEDEEEDVDTLGLPVGYRRASRRILWRLRRDRPRKWWRTARRIRKLGARLEAAEKPSELREVARSARRRSHPVGQFQKIKRQMGRRRESYFQKLELGGATPSQLRAAKTRWDWRYGRELRRVERRMRYPARYL